MEETIASGRIEVNLDDRSALSALDRIEAEYSRTMKHIDSMEAEASVDLDTSQFDRAEAEFRRSMAKIDGSRAEAEIGADLSELKRDLKAAEALVKEYDRRIAAAENNRSKASLRTHQKKAAAEAAALKAALEAEKDRLAALKQKNAELTIEERRLAAIQKREDARARAMAAEDRRQAAMQRQKSVLQERAVRLADKADRMREQAATKAAREAQRSAAAQQREIEAIPKLQRRYVELQQTMDKLSEQHRRARDDRAKAVYAVKIDEVIADREAIERRLKALGIDPIDIGVRLNPGNDFGVAMRTAIGDGYRRGGVGRAAINTGYLLGSAMSDGVLSGIKRNLRPSKILAGMGDWIQRAGTALGSLTVRIGPFTATMRQLLTAMTILGPVLVDIVGAAGSLVGVMGSATLGVGALAAGFLGGAIPAMLGFGFVIKDVIQEFSAAKKATKAYDDAVMKHGKNSDQATKKMKELKTVMGNVSDETVKQFVNAQKLGDAWDKATKPGRASVWKGIGNALQTASDLMPQFAKRTNEGLSIAERGISRMMKAVRSQEGRGILDNLMGNFNQALGPILNGLGNLAGYLGRVASVASDSIPGIAKTFERWSESILNTSENTSDLRRRVNETIQSAKDVGRFFMAAGRLVKAFFGGGVNAGQSFVNTMTNAMNRWTAFLNSAEGRNSLATFFKEAVAGTQAFWGFLQPIISSFARWATLMAPVARGFFAVAGGIADFVAALLRLTALQGPVTALLTTLGILWGINKVASATRAVTGFTKALFGMAAAQRVVAATGAAAAAGGVAGAARGSGMMVGAAAAGAVAGRTAANVGKLAKAGSMATTVMKGLGLATLGIASPIAGIAVAAGIAGFGLYKFMTRTRDYEKAQKGAEESTKRFTSAVSAMGPIQNQLAQDYLNTKNAQLQVKQAEKEVSALRKSGRTNTDEYTQAVLNLRQAEMNLIQNRNQLRVASDQETKAYRAMNSEARKALEQRNKQVEDLGKRGNTKHLFEEMSRGAKKAGQSLKEYLAGADYLAGNQKKRIQEYADAISAQERAQYRVRRAAELSVLATLNHQRAMKGLSSLTANTAGHFARLQKLGGKNLTQKIAVKFTDSGDAARVARSASATLKSGVPTRIVTKIVADSKNAEDAVRRLQRARIDPKRLRVIEEGGSRAVAMMRQLTGMKLPPKLQKIAEQGGQKALAMLNLIIGRKLTQKQQKILESGGSAVLGMLRQIASLSLPNKHQRITIETIRINTVRNQGGADFRNKAVGQKAGSKPINALIGEGAADEWRVNRRTGEVYKTDGPQFTRLDRDDAIIPTEPRYKERGKEIFKAIAKDLGIDMFAKSKKPAPKAKSKPKSDSVFGGSFGAEGFRPDATISRNKTFKPSKKVKRPFTARRGWAEYIEGLHTQQGYWEREVSIRESQVKEPADMIVEVGSRDVADPFTGEVTKVPIYAPNPEIENTYKPALDQVIQAMKVLMSIIVELVRAIPQAVAANRNEQSYHTASIADLNNEISRERNRAAGAKGKNKEKHERRMELAKDRRDKHVEARSELKESEKTLNSDRVDAGFDQREAAIAQANLQLEYDTASGEAATAVEEATKAAEPVFSNPNAGGGGAGGDAGGAGGGSTAADNQLSYGQQASLADTERANVLREFGSNMMGIMGTRPSAASAAGSGPGAINPALRDPNTSPGSFGGSQPSAASSTLSSDAAASQGVASGAGTRSASAAPAPSGPNRTVNITNNFQQPPPDSHTFVKGMEFEAAGAI